MSAHPTLRLVASYNSEHVQHFAEKGEADTLCGRNRENWMDMRPADLTTDLDSAYTCKRCARVVTS